METRYDYCGELYITESEPKYVVMHARTGRFVRGSIDEEFGGLPTGSILQAMEMTQKTANEMAIDLVAKGYDGDWVVKKIVTTRYPNREIHTRRFVK